MKLAKLMRVLLPGALAVLSTSITVQAESLHTSATSTPGSTKFLAVGRPSLLKIRGEGKGPEGNLQYTSGQVTGQLTVDVNSFNTGIEMRDHHMKEKYLETGKYPSAVLTIKKANMGEPSTLPKDIEFEGELNLHGQTQPIKGTAHVEKKSDGYAFNAKFPVNITDYKIEIPSYGGIKIADKVDVEVESVAKVAAASPGSSPSPLPPAAPSPSGSTTTPVPKKTPTAPATKN